MPWLHPLKWSLTYRQLCGLTKPHTSPTHLKIKTRLLAEGCEDKLTCLWIPADWSGGHCPQEKIHLPSWGPVKPEAMDGPRFRWSLSSFTFKIDLSLYIWSGFCNQHRVWVLLFIQYGNICLLMEVFGQFAFNVVIDMVQFKLSSCYLFSICSICSLSFRIVWINWMTRMIPFYPPIGVLAITGFAFYFIKSSWSTFKWHLTLQVMCMSDGNMLPFLHSASVPIGHSFDLYICISSRIFIFCLKSLFYFK